MIERTVSFKIRNVTILFILNLMLSVQSVTLIESVFPLHINKYAIIILFTGVFPLFATITAYFRYSLTFESVSYEGQNPLFPVKAGIIAFFLWAGGYFSVGFFSETLTMHSLETVFDLHFPYVPEWIYVYLTIYTVFLISFFVQKTRKDVLKLGFAYILMLAVNYAIMLLYPVAFNRPAAAGPPFTYYAMSAMHSLDPPHNCFPSSHCAVAALASFAVFRTGINFFSIYLFITALAISVSTLFTKQHFLFDVLSGWMLASVVAYLVYRKNLGNVVIEKTNMFFETFTRKNR